MAMTAAERAKKYRDNKKKDPNTHEEYLAKERERYKKRKANGEFNFSQKSQREITLMRRKWRTNKRNERKKKKLFKAGTDFIQENTPLNSPVRHDFQDDVAMPEDIRAHDQNRSPPQDLKCKKTHQSASAKKRVKRKKAKVYRALDRLKKENGNLKSLWEATRKRIQRMKAKQKQVRSVSAPKNIQKTTPIKESNVTKIVRKVYKASGHSVTWNIKMRRQIRQFLEEDINSSQAPGKKDTITKNKIKKQKRYLNDTLLNLWKGFLEKHHDCQLSYTSFCRLRPFWVVQKKIDSRETCLCRVHENVKYKIQALHRMKIIKESNPDKVTEYLVCDDLRKECAYRECSLCSAKELPNELTEDRAGEQTKYYQWVNRTEEISTKTGNKTVTKTLKVLEQNTIENLFKDTVAQLKDKYIKHIFNIKHQYTQLTKLKNDLKSTEFDAVIHVDFSENFNCKMAEEVQAMHFGGSRNQISLHTVVVYTKDMIESFCSVAENTQHGPAAIWAHMKPVLDHLMKKHPTLRNIHFVSDGPCTQYRSKNNFFLFHQEILTKYNYERASWNFTESGHGKSSADGVGGVVKRTADRLVANGIDIPDAESFYNNVGEQLHSVRLFYVEDRDFESERYFVPSGLQTVKGTMKLHQVNIRKEKRGTLHLKSLSCFCKWPEWCCCYTLTETPVHVLTSTQIIVPADTIIAAPESTHTASDKRKAPDSLPATPCESIVTPDPTCTLSDNRKEPSDTTATNQHSAILPHPELVGTWCVVNYENQAYPGIIQDLDEESAEVKCMSRIGPNRFFWPLLEDVIWYRWDDLMMTIPEPQPVTTRHVQIQPDIWQEICLRLCQR